MSLIGNNRKLHKLKSVITSFLGVEGRVQIRKDDRSFSVKDVVLLEEIGPEGHKTGYCQAGTIDHVIREFEGLEEGYVVLVITPVDILIHDGEKYVTKKRL